MRPGGEKPREVGGTSAPNTSYVQNTNEKRQHAGSLSKRPFIPSLTFPLTTAQAASLTGGRHYKELYLKAVFYILLRGLQSVILYYLLTNPYTTWGHSSI